MSLPEGETGRRANGSGNRPEQAALVAAFLRANPGWLAEHPELYQVLAPPLRVHGEGLADHMAAITGAGARGFKYFSGAAANLVLQPAEQK